MDHLKEQQEQQLKDSLFLSGDRFANVDLSDLAKRSLWDGRKENEIWSFYCPLCACSRKIRGRPAPGGVKHVAQILITTAACMLATWPWFAWKGFVVIVPLWGAFELSYRMRMRGAVACPYCGFDPFLYLRDRPTARREVERHWRKIFEEKGIPYPQNSKDVTARAGATKPSDAESETPEIAT